MWSKGDEWAVMEEKGKRAKKVVFNERDAKNYIVDHAFELVKPYIQIRPGTDGRCQDYCAVRDICPQRKARLDLMVKK
jgi:hypothetical protein